jgi:hypothetical protein
MHRMNIPQNSLKHAEKTLYDVFIREYLRVLRDILSYLYYSCSKSIR